MQPKGNWAFALVAVVGYLGNVASGVPEKAAAKGEACTDGAGCDKEPRGNGEILHGAAEGNRVVGGYDTPDTMGQYRNLPGEEVGGSTEGGSVRVPRAKQVLQDGSTGTGANGAVRNDGAIREAVSGGRVERKESNPAKPSRVPRPVIRNDQLTLGLLSDLASQENESMSSTSEFNYDSDDSSEDEQGAASGFGGSGTGAVTTQAVGMQTDNGTGTTSAEEADGVGRNRTSPVELEMTMSQQEDLERVTSATPGLGNLLNKTTTPSAPVEDGPTTVQSVMPIGVVPEPQPEKPDDGNLGGNGSSEVAPVTENVVVADMAVIPGGTNITDRPESGFNPGGAPGHGDEIVWVAVEHINTSVVVDSTLTLTGGGNTTAAEVASMIRATHY